MLPLYSILQSREADEYAAGVLGIPGIVLMENAARSIFDAVVKGCALQPDDKISILCGKGNNGGDGFALARHLCNFGCFVSVVTCFDGEDIQGDAGTNYRILKNMLAHSKKLSIINHSDDKIYSAMAVSKVIIDAMLGTGSKGELKEPYLSLVNKVNEIDSLKVAIDIPTGLDAELGTGKYIFDADMTVTMAAPKKGLYFGAGKVFSGKVSVGQIGIGNEYFDKLDTDCYLIEQSDVASAMPLKKKDSHKYSAGKVLVIAGSASYTGAATLTASAALNTGAGASVLCFPQSVCHIVQSKLDEEVVLSYKDDGRGYLAPENIEELNDKLQWADVIAIGPGLGREKQTADAVSILLKKLKGRKVVLDADGIAAISGSRCKEMDIQGFVLTPHHMEFARLIGIAIDELKKDILNHGIKFSIDTKSYLVLKGAPTIIFTPDGKCFINSAGNPGMSKFGTGDVLTGMTASFVAQSENIREALINSVYLHSYAADLAAEDKTVYCITASDIIDYFPKAVKFVIPA